MSLKKLFRDRLFLASIASFLVTIIIIAGFTMYGLQWQQRQKESEMKLKAELSKTEKSLKELQTQDQYVINKKLSQNIKDIETTYKKTVTTYEQILDLKAQKQKTDELDKLLTQALSLLSERNYSSAEAVLVALDKQLATTQKTAVSTTASIPQNVTTNNTPPVNSYSRQYVKADIGTYTVDVIAGDLATTKVIVDTASEGDCKDGCPTFSLGDYVARNGAYAGINGSYFCPAEYPSCAGKTNSFDTLLMNKNKVYFNSDNNVYSTVPAVIFLGSGVRFVGRSLEWGRDTGVDSVIANQPLLVSGKQVAFGGDDDPKKGSKGSRSFVANIGNTVYIGVVHNVTVAEAAHVLVAMGMENALNLDSGGSTALWYNGYKAGPGRNIPNAILFVRR